MGSRQLCTFGVDDLQFGISVREVEEVSRRHAMTRVPLAPPAVRGLINLRGRIVTGIDMRERLRLPPRDEEAETFHIVVSSGESSVSLLVDRIGDVVDVADSAFERPPETMRTATRELVRGVYKLERQLLLVLDLDRTVAFATR